MKVSGLALLSAGVLMVSACANDRDDMIAPAPPIGPGALAGTMAADRDGDGIVDGYYTPDGSYVAIQGPPCPPPPPPPPVPTPRGERG